MELNGIETHITWLGVYSIINNRGNEKMMIVSKQFLKRQGNQTQVNENNINETRKRQMRYVVYG